jgi:hypothetical protein
VDKQEGPRRRFKKPVMVFRKVSQITLAIESMLTFMIQKCGLLLNIWVAERVVGDMRVCTYSFGNLQLVRNPGFENAARNRTGPNKCPGAELCMHR